MESRKVRRRSGGGQKEIRESGEGDNSDRKQPPSTMEQGGTVMVEEETLDDPADEASKKSGNGKNISLADWNRVGEQRGIVKVVIQTGEQQEDGEVEKVAHEKIFGEPDDRSPADDASRKFENDKDIYLEDFSDEELVERALEEEFEFKRDWDLISTLP